MNLLIFTNHDIESNLMLNLLLPELSISHRINVFISDKVGKNGDPPRELKELKFFEQQLIRDVVFPQIDAQNRKNSEKLLTFQELSRTFGISIEPLNEVRSDASLKKISDLQPDLVLSVRYGKIFGNTFVDIPKKGIINLHSGILPNYRGVLATFRALQNGDKQIGTTLHFIENNTIDTGTVIGHAYWEVNPEKSLLWHILSLYPASKDLVLKTIQQIDKGEKLPLIQQNEADSAYFSFPNEEDLAKFVQKGWKIVDYEEYLEFLKNYQ